MHCREAGVSGDGSGGSSPWERTDGNNSNVSGASTESSPHLTPLTRRARQPSARGVQAPPARVRDLPLSKFHHLKFHL